MSLSPTDREQLVELVKSHTETARAAYDSRNHEIELLKGRIAVLSQMVSDLQLENMMLRRGVPPLNQGDSR